MAEEGDRREVDLLVKDTAGCDYNKAPPDLMVSSFGKAARATMAGKGEYTLNQRWTSYVTFSPCMFSFECTDKFLLKISLINSV